MNIFKLFTKKGRKQLRVERLWRIAFNLSDAGSLNWTVNEEDEIVVLLPPLRPRPRPRPRPKLTEVEEFKKAAMFE